MQRERTARARPCAEGPTQDAGRASGSARGAGYGRVLGRETVRPSAIHRKQEVAEGARREGGPGGRRAVSLEREGRDGWERPQEAEDKGKGHGRSPGGLLGAGAGAVAPGERRLSQARWWPCAPRDCEPSRGIRGQRWGLGTISGAKKDPLPSFTQVGLRVAKGPLKRPKLESLWDVALERAPHPTPHSHPGERRD